MLLRRERVVDPRAIAAALDDAFVDDHVRRAKDHGYAVFCMTVDTAMYSRRERDLARRFVKATIRSWEAAMQDPAAAVEAAAKAKPGINKEILRAQLAASLKLVPPPDGSRMPFGSAPAAYWDQTLDILKKYQGLKTEAATTDHYNYSFLPKQ